MNPHQWFGDNHQWTIHFHASCISICCQPSGALVRQAGEGKNSAAMQSWGMFVDYPTVWRTREKWLSQLHNVLLYHDGWDAQILQKATCCRTSIIYKIRKKTHSRYILFHKTVVWFLSAYMVFNHDHTGYVSILLSILIVSSHWNRALAETLTHVQLDPRILTMASRSFTG